jgi:hypothetical protein
LESIQQWRQNTDHQRAKEKGKKGFYKKYTIRIAKVERDYAFEKKLQDMTYLQTIDPKCQQGRLLRFLELPLYCCCSPLFPVYLTIK